MPLFGGSIWLTVRECAAAWFARYREITTVPFSPGNMTQLYFQVIVAKNVAAHVKGSRTKE